MLLVTSRDRYTSGNEESPYFEIVSFISNPDKYEFHILWKPLAIGGSDGFIVQKVNAVSNISGVGVEDKPYFEAWIVEGGKTGNVNYDDDFSCPVIENGGTVEYYTEVYWIDKSDELFEIVSKWKPYSVFMANELSASFTFPEIASRKSVFQRRFIYDNRNAFNIN